MEYITTKYSLTKRQRTALTAYANGEITITEVARRMNTSRQRVVQCLAAITKHASTTGRIDFAEIIKNY